MGGKSSECCRFTVDVDRGGQLLEIRGRRERQLSKHCVHVMCPDMYVF